MIRKLILAIAGATFNDFNNTVNPDQNYKSTGFGIGFSNYIRNLSLNFRR